tara:strand:- start:162 stop:1046 length:885 start_codon:yes stop_codon:yes gene_type:complete
MAFKMTPKSPVLMATGRFGSPAKNMNKGYGPAKTSSPAKQRTMDEAYEKRDMNIYGDLDRVEYGKEANRQINVRNKEFDLYKDFSKASNGGESTQTDYSGGATKDGSCSREDDACNMQGQGVRKREIKWDAPKTKMKSKTKKVTTLKAEGPKNEGGGLPVGKPIGAKEIKVTKKVAKTKPTRSQKIRAKGEKVLADKSLSTEDKQKKSLRLRKRYDRVEAREEKRAGRKAARGAKRGERQAERDERQASRKEARASRQIAKGEKKNKMTMTKSKVAKKAKPVKRKAMDPSRMEN